MKTIFTTRDITQPLDGLVVCRNHFWMCLDGDPKKALFYNKTPQANTDIKCCEWYLNSTSFLPENTKIVFIDIAFIPNRY